MERNVRTGRAIGAAMLGGAVLEAWSNFALQAGLFEGGGFLANAAGKPRIIGLIIVTGLLAGLLPLCAATLLMVWEKSAFPFLSRIYWVLSAIALAATLVELSTFVAMRDLSEQFVAAGADAGSRFEVPRIVLRGLRNGLHFSTKTFQGAGLLAFYLLLFRARAVPLLLAGAGILSAILQMASVGAPLFGGEVDYRILAPMGVVYLATAAWLLFRGLPRALPRPDLV